MTPDEAKEKVYAHWQHLEALCRRRFPNDENLVHEALLYVLEKLQANAWQRVRSWRPWGSFLAFITTLATHLLVDFSRTKFGYVRKPAWLAAKKDALWDSAYHLLMAQGYTRQEAGETLRTYAPERDPRFIDHVISTILEKCPKPMPHGQDNVTVEDLDEYPSAAEKPEDELDPKDKEIIEALEYYLENGNPGSPMPEGVGALVERLRPHVRLTAEDRLLLRMRFLEGMDMKTIARLAHVQGDPYKRLHKILNHLRTACRRAGVLD